MKVGDLVRWKKDGDLGIVTKVKEWKDEVFICWTLEPNFSA